jgi:hypothetical protein
MEFKETMPALSDPPRDQEQQEVKQPKQRVQPPQAQQRAPTTDRKAQKSAVKRPRDENSGSADRQKRYSEKLLGVQRKLFALADAWNIELVLLVGGRTIEPAFSSFRPGALTEWMLSNQVAASIAKSVADKPKQSGGDTSVRSDKFTQGTCDEMISVSRNVRHGQSPSICVFSLGADSLEAMPVAGIRTLMRQLLKNIAMHKVRKNMSSDDSELMLRCLTSLS